MGYDVYILKYTKVEVESVCDYLSEEESVELHSYSRSLGVWLLQNTRLESDLDSGFLSKETIERLLNNLKKVNSLTKNNSLSLDTVEEDSPTQLSEEQVTLLDSLFKDVSSYDRYDSNYFFDVRKYIVKLTNLLSGWDDDCVYILEVTR